jgi:hypothetical protein
LHIIQVFAWRKVSSMGSTSSRRCALTPSDSWSPEVLLGHDHGRCMGNGGLDPSCCLDTTLNKHRLISPFLLVGLPCSTV